MTGLAGYTVRAFALGRGGATIYRPSIDGFLCID